MHLRMIVAAAIFSTPAWADITSEDVWANTTAFYAATGGHLTANVLREGDTTFVEDVRLRYKLPFGMGDLRIALPPRTLIELSDGSVQHVLPKSRDYAMSLETDAWLGFRVAMTGQVVQQDLNILATGSPGNVTYTVTSGPSRGTGAIQFILLGDYGETLGMALDVAVDGHESVTTIIEGDLLEIVHENSYSPLAMSMEFDEGHGYRSEFVADFGLSKANIAMAIPSSGFDLENISSALDQGLTLDMATSSEFAYDETRVYFEDELVSEDNTRTGVTNSTLRLSNEGLDISGDVADLEFSILEQEFADFTAAGGANYLSGRLALPLMASEDPQDVVLTAQGSGITVADETWDLVDAGRSLMREPASFDIDLSGSIVTSVDLLDFEALEDAFYQRDQFVLPVTVNIDALDLNFAGASVSGAGAFDFDTSDMDTFVGMPRPAGEASIAFSGINSLLDAVIDAGLAPESEVGMGRMMLGMFTKSTGDDRSEASVVIDQEGGLFVNGQRLR